MFDVMSILLSKKSRCDCSFSCSYILLTASTKRIEFSFILIVKMTRVDTQQNVTQIPYN